ncbi:MAG: hypothetical protein SXV54_19350 [Chloroflexota bacterium]|nr:hypothetical protein [Chloroflexota bacterium]
MGKKRLYHPLPPFPARSDQGTAETQGGDSVDSITAVQSVLRCHAGGLLPASQIGVLLAGPLTVILSGSDNAGTTVATARPRSGVSRRRQSEPGGNTRRNEQNEMREEIVENRSTREPKK